MGAGKVAQNLSNLHFRRGNFAEAEQLYEFARQRFTRANDARLIASAENGLANILTQRHQFAQARQLFEQVLAHVTAAGLLMQQAGTECNLGVLALSQGQYDRALDYLERSRRGYQALGMPNEAAILVEPRSVCRRDALEVLVALTPEKLSRL